MFQPNPTQAVGAISFFIVVVAAALAWRLARDDKRLWGGIALVHVLLTAEMAFEMRFPMAASLRSLLRGVDLYGERRAWQAGLLIALLVLLVPVLLAVSRRCGSAAAIALVTTVLTAFIFVMEGVSLHQVDAVLYWEIGPVLLVGWVWVGLAAMTTLAAAAVMRPTS